MHSGVTPQNIVDVRLLLWAEMLCDLLPGGLNGSLLQAMSSRSVSDLQLRPASCKREVCLEVHAVHLPSRPHCPAEPQRVTSIASGCVHTAISFFDTILPGLLSYLSHACWDAGVCECLCRSGLGCHCSACHAAGLPDGMSSPHGSRTTAISHMQTQPERAKCVPSVCLALTLTKWGKERKGSQCTTAGTY